MMQYPKSSLKYEGDQLNRELGKGSIFPAPKQNSKFGSKAKGSNSTVNDFEEIGAGGDITNMSKTIGSIFNKTGMRDTTHSGADMSHSNALKDISKIVGEGQDRSRPVIPKGFNSVNSSQQSSKIPSIKESTDHIKKVLMECNFMRTRSKKLENGVGGFTASINNNAASRFASSALDNQKNSESKVYNNALSRHSALS
jgi:hypothetical protein